MPRPGPGSPRGGAPARIDALLDQIDGLGPRRREQLYLRLLYGRPAPAASPSPATALANPATVLANPATELQNPVTPVTAPRPPAGLPPDRTVPSDKLAKQAPSVDLKDPATWPTDPARLVDEVFLSKASKLLLMRLERPGQVRLRISPLGVSAQLPPRIDKPMLRQDAERFVVRFVVPLLKHNIGRKWLAAVASGRHPVGILLATGSERFGLTGTVPMDPDAANEPQKGSLALIFIDEHGRDWKDVPDLDSMPDIGFFHELYHAAKIQRGRNDGMTEREARIEENRYRHPRGASSQRALP